MEFSIFSNSELTQEIDNNILFESHTYFIKFNNSSFKEIDRFINENNLYKYVSIIHSNNVGTINLLNLVGQLKIGKKLYDIRTNKLYPDELGKEQFQLLLNEVNTLSKALTFNYNSPITSNYLEDFSDPAPSLLEKFNYYRQIVFNKEVHFLVELCFSNLNSKREYQFKKTSIFSLTKLSGQELRSAFSFSEFGKTDINLKENKLSVLIKKATSKDFIPLFVKNRKTTFTIDTIENQFIKYFLEEIKTISITITQTYKGRILQDAHAIVKTVNSILSKPEFRSISRLQHFPLHSQVLQKRSGYREIFNHYLLSRVGHKNLLDDLTSIKSPLKDIAKLYEIWVLYKIASCLFPGKILAKKNRIFQGNSLRFQLLWADDRIELGYTLSFSRVNVKNKSYSLLLIPDFTILNKLNNKVYIFDAKFKSKNSYTADTPDIPKQFKREDIYKMHTYLDAIPKAVSAIEIYPGTEFVFFDKSTFEKYNDFSKVDSFNGVGAIPAIPTDTIQLDYLLNILNLK